VNGRQAVLEFALRAAGTAGVAFEEFARWLSPWGYPRDELEATLLDEARRGTVELIRGPKGIRLSLGLTSLGERLLNVRRTPGPLLT
jgi:hypothetical protein